jgi:hypothetical protein
MPVRSQGRTFSAGAFGHSTPFNQAESEPGFDRVSPSESAVRLPRDQRGEDEATSFELAAAHLLKLYFPVWTGSLEDLGGKKNVFDFR